MGRARKVARRPEELDHIEIRGVRNRHAVEDPLPLKRGEMVVEVYRSVADGDEDIRFRQPERRPWQIHHFL